MSGQVLDVGGGGSTSGGGGGVGDVVGPASAITSRVAIFNGTTGKLLSDGGQTVASLQAAAVAEAATATATAVAAIAGGGGEASQNSFLVQGGQVAWKANYVFTVSAATYYIGGTLYSSSQTDITLSAAHGSLDRIDTIAVNNIGTVVKVDGMAAATPSEPDIDPGTQLKLAIVFVSTATTAPVALSNTTLYTEQAGSGAGEWDWTASAGSIVVNSTSNPRTGTKDIEGTNVVAGVYAQGAIGSGTFNPNDYGFLVLHVRSKATWNNNRGLQVSLRTANVLVGQTISINRSGTFGFESATVGSYQQVAIPISQFAIPSGQTITQLRIADFGGAIGFHIDDITFQAGALTQNTVGITQAQADARYTQLGSNPGSVVCSIDGGGVELTTGVKAYVRCPYAGTIVAARLLADVSGSVVVDVWRDTYANYPPVAGDKITASAPPTITTALKSQDTTLTGWTKTVNAGDIFAFSVTSVTTITKVTVELEIARSN